MVLPNSVVFGKWTILSKFFPLKSFDKCNLWRLDSSQPCKDEDEVVPQRNKTTERQFSISVFDKRDDFPFSRVRMPHRRSNIPTNMFYATLSSEILWIEFLS